MYRTRFLAMACAAALTVGGTCAYMKPEWDANRAVIWREESGQSDVEGIAPIEVSLVYGLNAKEQPVAAYMNLDAAEALGAEGNASLRVRYLYDRAGNQIASQTFTADGKLDMERRITYDTYGNPLHEDGYFPKRHEYVYDDRGRFLKDSIYETEDGVELLSSLIECVYTDHPDGGYTVESSEETFGSITIKLHRVITYDAQDRPLSQDFTLDGGDPRHVAYRYDDDGRQIETVIYENGVLQERTVTEYDVDGLYARSTSYDGAGAVTSTSTSRLLDGPPV